MDKKDGDLSFESFKNINKSNFFGDTEYIYSIFKIKELPVDLLFKILNLIFPDFLINENHIFLASEFDQDKFDNLQKVEETNKAQFWMNLIELTSLHDEMTAEQALLIAQKIVDSWNAKIKYEGLNAHGRARVFEEIEYGEIFITID
ncbi:hypothetical protein [Acinetobacter seifertii]|uniref:Uncharacterized protein n=1 Tax=Acinetobacter seifertii TaxID=1530123 RepID=A0A7H2PYJ5_9GAMM|nr:hypothetical protein [Acinetobacter seifertii]PJG67470.1 hypothetical protein CVD09_05660 [Acinetobacter seifertii]QNX07928.1 hypothetical protein IC795_12420 [Acinetobacter seifertii]QNX48047.1 hypothetical protein IC784_12340 [Acinetobacter seifertii]